MSAPVLSSHLDREASDAKALDIGAGTNEIRLKLTSREFIGATR